MCDRYWATPLALSGEIQPGMRFFFSLLAPGRHLNKASLHGYLTFASVAILNEKDIGRRWEISHPYCAVYTLYSASAKQRKALIAWGMQKNADRDRYIGMFTSSSNTIPIKQCYACAYSGKDPRVRRGGAGPHPANPSVLNEPAGGDKPHPYDDQVEQPGSKKEKSHAYSCSGR